LLGVKLSRQSIDASVAVHYGQEGEFREFAASLVRAIARSTLDPPPGR
jgi:hypothetical protein